MKAIDFSKPVTFSILDGMLERSAFTQLSLSKEKGVSLGQVNKVAKYLIERNLIDKDSGSYSVNSAFGVIGCIAKTREMSEQLIERIETNYSKEEALNLMGQKGTLCLDSALEQHRPEISSGRVCAYVDGKEVEKLVSELKKNKGNNTAVWLFSADLPIATENVNNRNVTAKRRTAIDLTCDNAAFAASSLFEELWEENIL